MFEIRNYHFEPTKLDAYKQWAETLAVPFLSQKMDVVGFWIKNDLEPEYGGVLPPDERAGPANVTWIIRWQDKTERDQVWRNVRAGSEWQEIYAQVPGGRASYLRIEAIFAAEV